MNLHENVTMYKKPAPAANVRKHRKKQKKNSFHGDFLLTYIDRMEYFD